MELGVPDQGGRSGREPAVPLHLRKRRRGLRDLEQGSGRPRRAYLPLRQGGQLLGAWLRPLRPLLGDLLRPGREVRLRQARLHRRLRLRPLYGGLEQRLLPVRQRRPRQLYRAGPEEHRHRHGPGASGRGLSGRGLPVRCGYRHEHHPQGHRADRRNLRPEP